MKRRAMIVGALTVTLAMGLTACGSSKNTQNTSTNTSGETAVSAGEESAEGAVTGTKQGETVLKCAFNQSAENPEAEAVRQMSDALYDATEGRYSIEVYPNELLGNQQDSLSSVQAGAVDMALVANSIVEGVNADFAVIGTPYMFDTIDDMETLFTNDNQALEDLFSSTDSSGFHVLTAYCLGARNVYTRDHAVTTPEELSGMKIRVMQSDTMIKMMNNMGGVGTPMSQGDVYSAIQTGTLDGAENNIITYMDLKQYEVAPYYSETSHLMIPDEVVISSMVYDTMSDEDKAALEQVAKESTTTAFALCKEMRATYEKDAEEAGVEIVEVDIAPFQEACQELIERNANLSDTTKAVYEEIQKLNK